MGGLAVAYDVGNGLSVVGSATHTEGKPIIDDLGTGETAQRRIGRFEKLQTFELGAECTGASIFIGGDALTLRGNLYHTELRDI